MIQIMGMLPLLVFDMKTVSTYNIVAAVRILSMLCLLVYVNYTKCIRSQSQKKSDENNYSLMKNIFTYVSHVELEQSHMFHM